MPVTINGTTGISTPGQDLTNQPEKVVAIAQAAWTVDVIAAYQAQQEANSPAPERN